MNNYYGDIIEPMESIGKKPLWFDENAVPRYIEFSPEHIANIYANSVLLMEIQCQSCGHHFKVAMSQSSSELLLHKVPTLASMVNDNSIHYGDPPNTDCCPSGPTMNSVALRVIQFWSRNKNGEWARDSSLEKEIDD